MLDANKGYQYDRIQDESVYCVRITKDGEFFADILFLDFYLDAQALKERGAERPQGAFGLPYSSSGLRAGQQQNLINHYKIDMADGHLQYITHLFCSLLTEALNDPEKHHTFPDQRKWIYSSPRHNPDILRVARDVGSNGTTNGVAHLAFADISFANPEARQITKSVIAAALNELTRKENELFTLQVEYLQPQSGPQHSKHRHMGKLVAGKASQRIGSPRPH